MATTRVVRQALGATALAVALAGCPLQHKSTLTASSSASASTSPVASSSSSSPSSSSPSSPSSSSPSSVNDRSADAPTARARSRIVRSELQTLHGLTPEQAKLQLKKLGHDGEVKLGVVTDMGGGQTFNEACGINKVCETSGASGMGVHDDITLYLNPTLTIAPPPQ